MATIPDFETLILDRLEICNGEIKQAGDAKRVYRLPPVFALDVGECPALAVRPGRMRNRLPANSQRQAEVKRDYVVEVIALPLGNTQDTGSKGADALAAASLLFAKLRNYYMNHRRLETDGTTQAKLAGLQYMNYDIEFDDGGFVVAKAPGGAEHIGIEFAITTSMSATT